METQHWLDEAFACHYIDKDQADELKDELMRIGRMLNSMLRNSSLFCGQGDSTVRDEISEYYT